MSGSTDSIKKRGFNLHDLSENLHKLQPNHDLDPDFDFSLFFYLKIRNSNKVDSFAANIQILTEY